MTYVFTTELFRQFWMLCQFQSYNKQPRVSTHPTQIRFGSWLLIFTTQKTEKASGIRKYGHIMGMSLCKISRITCGQGSLVRNYEVWMRDYYTEEYSASLYDGYMISHDMDMLSESLALCVGIH